MTALFFFFLVKASCFNSLPNELDVVKRLPHCGSEEPLGQAGPSTSSLVTLCPRSSACLWNSWEKASKVQVRTDGRGCMDGGAVILQALGLALARPSHLGWEVWMIHPSTPGPWKGHCHWSPQDSKHPSWGRQRWHHSYGRKWRRTKGLLDESERGEWNSWLKLNIQKTKIMASGPITSWQIDGKNGNSGWLYFSGLQNHCRWWL